MALASAVAKMRLRVIVCNLTCALYTTLESSALFEVQPVDIIYPNSELVPDFFATSFNWYRQRESYYSFQL